MGKKEVSYHIHHERENSNCATAALYALLPHFPDGTSIQALYRNTFELREIFTVLAYEYSKIGVTIDYRTLPANLSPSKFFYGIARELNHANNDGLEFIGGMLLAEGLEMNHVIAINKIHESKKPKFDIVDTNQNDSKIIRSVSGNFLDRRIIPPERYDPDYGPLGIAIVGMPVETFIQSPDFTPNLMHEIAMRNQTAAINTIYLLQRAGVDICDTNIEL